MIIIQLLGGLGNQMFQYAMGRAVAIHRNDTLKLDISEFSQYSLRKYALSHYRIQESFVTSAEIEEILHQPMRNDPWNIRKHFHIFLPYYQRPLFQEQSFSYDPNILNAQSNVLFSGYWQSEKYFKSIEGIIRDDFGLKEIPDDYNQDMAKIMLDSNSVNLHVRRGDYASNPATLQHHGLCSVEYYTRAIQYINENIDEPEFFLFSDDISWVKDHLDIPEKSHFISHNGTEKDYLDLWLMSHCKHHIIANSSFSWWGAWLQKNSDKVVIAPAKWFNDKTIDTRDLIPESWIKIKENA